MLHHDFSSSVCVQTGSGTRPASCTMRTRGSFPGLKRGRDVMLTTYPHLVPTLRMSRSYTSSPPSAFMVCTGTAKKNLHHRKHIIWKGRIINHYTHRIYLTKKFPNSEMFVTYLTNIFTPKVMPQNSLQ
jgi:hypothetical protein